MVRAEQSMVPGALKMTAVLMTVLSAAGCTLGRSLGSVDPNMPWPNADAERAARIAAAGRMSCDVVGVAATTLKTGNDGEAAGRDPIRLKLVTRTDPASKQLMQPYENGTEGHPNPHASRVMWDPYVSASKIVGGLPIRKPFGSYIQLEQENSTATYLSLIPLKNYKPGTRMNVAVTAEVTSRIEEDDKSWFGDKKFTKIAHEDVATGTAYCGELEQTGDRHQGALGWIVVKFADKPADTVVETKRDQKFDCTADDAIEVCMLVSTTSVR